MRQFARRIFFCSTHLLQGLALKQQLLFLFGLFVTSMFVSGCIQTFTSASRRCHFTVVSRRGLSFTHFYFFRHHLPFCRILRLPVAIVGCLVILLFHRRPLIRSLQLVVAIVGLPLMSTRFRPKSPAGEL